MDTFKKRRTCSINNWRLLAIRLTCKMKGLKGNSLLVWL